MHCLVNGKRLMQLLEIRRFWVDIELDKSWEMNILKIFLKNLQKFRNHDFYVFGIVSSIVHRSWMDAQKSTLGETTAYTPTTCFETFPFPQTINPQLVQKIRAKAEELHQYRTQQMELKKWGITTLYNNFYDEPSSQLYTLHEQLDKLVMQAYGFSQNDDILEKLLELNLYLAEKEKQRKLIIGPWSPLGNN